MYTVKNAEWMDSFFTRNNWTHNLNDDQLGDSWLAVAQIMLAAATMLTNDPVKIARHLSLPLPYVCATIWNLDRNIYWTTEAYKDLALRLAADPVEEVQLCDALHTAMEQFWEVEQPARIDLVQLWAAISWATGEDLLLGTVAPGRII